MRHVLALTLLVLLAGCKTTGSAGTKEGESGDKDAVWREDSTGKPQPEQPRAESPPDSAEAPAQPGPAPGDPPPDSMESNPEPGPREEDPKSSVREAEKPARPERAPESPEARLAHEKLADDFIDAVRGQAPRLKKSKSFVQFEKDLKAFNDAHDRALLERRKAVVDKDAVEAAWADAIKAWFEARYALKRFVRLHATSAPFEPVNVGDRPEVLNLGADKLRSPECRRANAAQSLADPHFRELNLFRTGTLRYDLVANNVFESKDWAKHFGDAQTRFEDAANGKFDEDDLKKFKD